MIDATISWNSLLYAAIALMAVWGFIKVIMEIVGKITARHDREKSWDETRKKITEKYDERLNDIEAKMQEIRAEQCLIVECQQAILDGLGQLKCNGPVTEQKHKLDKYLNERAHD